MGLGRFLHQPQQIPDTHAKYREIHHYEGEKRGFTQGTHWGMFVGACATLVVVAIAAIGGAFAVGAGYIALG